MSTVYVPQVPHRRDNATNKFIPTINISSADEHGDIVILLPPHAPFSNSKDLIDTLSPQLGEYDFDAGDSIMAVGDPFIIATIAGMLAKQFGKLNLLKWDRQSGRYIKIKIIL